MSGVAIEPEDALVERLIRDRRIKEYRETIKDAMRDAAGNRRFQGVAAHAYVSLARLWRLEEEEASVLLGIPVDVYLRWCEESDIEDIDVELIEKISCLLGIYRNLYDLFSGNIESVETWLTKPNAGDLFAGSTPFSILANKKPAVFHLVRQRLSADLV